MPKFAAYPNIGQRIRRYPLAGGAAFKEGAFVVLAAGLLNECGADPASILGTALHDAGADPETGQCLVAIAHAGASFILQGTSAPVAGDIGLSYGIAKDGDGIWVVDKTDVVNTRVRVEKVYLTRAQFEVRVLAANMQLT